MRIWFVSAQRTQFIITDPPDFETVLFVCKWII